MERRPGLQLGAGSDEAVLERRRRAQADEEGEERLQRHARRHDLLGQRGARAAQPDRAERQAEVGEVQDQPEEQVPPGAPRVGRLLLPVGRPRVRERLLAEGELVRQQRERQRRDAVQARRAGLPRLRAGALDEAQRPVSLLPLGQEPAGVLPGRAHLPQRQRRRGPRVRQPADGRAGPGAHGAAVHPHALLGRDALARAARVAGVPRPDQRAPTGPSSASGSSLRSSGPSSARPPGSRWS